MGNVNKALVALALAIVALTAAAPALADTYVTEGRVAYKDCGDHMEVWDYFDPGITGATGATGRLIEYIESNAREYNKRIVDWDYNPSLYSTSSGCAWRVTLDENNGNWYTYCDRNQWQKIEPYTIATEPNTGTDLVIPARVNGKPVTALRRLAFGSALLPSDPMRGRVCKATTIDLSATSITSIPAGGFNACTDVISVRLPNTVTSIGEGAFKWADTLQNINVPSNLKTVGKDAFYGCKQSIQAQFAGYPEKERKGHWETKTITERVPAPKGWTVMYRLRNPYTNEHFYTDDVDERDDVIAHGWEYEAGGDWYAPTNKTSSVPVWRLYNPNAPGGDHHYTIDKHEYDVLCGLGWRGEGIGWYSGGTKRFHREYNPNEYAHNHNYTLDDNEHRVLTTERGWRNEDGNGCWYGRRVETRTRTEQKWVWDE